MDELPQLLSIWKGDMSLVGPRTLAIDEIVYDDQGNTIQYENIPGFWERLSVRPGLTSISTIFKRKDIHPRKKFRYDLFYIRNMSLWLDIYLVMISLWVSIRGKWESRDEKL
jgi:lipopolysaccharide/colanic/teichoic acid biosynthesis glycosyltransferase